MAKGKRRQKAIVARAKRKAAKLAGHQRREDGLPDEKTKYGKRWHARRRGEGMANRSNERPAWFKSSAEAAFAQMRHPVSIEQ